MLRGKNRVAVSMWFVGLPCTMHLMVIFWLIYTNLLAWSIFFRPEEDLHTLVRSKHCHQVLFSRVLLQPISVHRVVPNSVTHTHIYTIPHLCPPCRVDVQNPGILESLVIYVHSPNDKQLGVIFSIVEATGSMGVPTHRPRGSLKLLKFGPLLGKLKCNRLHY